MQIDHDRYNLLIGYQETAYSRETLEYMIGKLNEERTEYMKLFTGFRITETQKYGYDIFPDAGRETQVYSLAGFSKSGGITEADGQNDITVSFRSDAEGSLPRQLPDGPLYTGIVYRMPWTVQAIVSHQKKEFLSRRIEVLQLGSLQALPSEFRRVEFDLETGGLKSVVLD